MGIAVVPPHDGTPPEPGARWDHTAKHSVQFYGEDSSLLDELSRFVGTELVAGGAAIVIATQTHRDGLAQRLQSRGFDTERAVEQGRYIALDAAETLTKFLREEWPDADLFTQVIGCLLYTSRCV